VLIHHWQSLPIKCTDPATVNGLGALRLYHIYLCIVVCTSVDSDSHDSSCGSHYPAIEVTSVVSTQHYIEGQNAGDNAPCQPCSCSNSHVATTLPTTLTFRTIPQCCCGLALQVWATVQLSKPCCPCNSSSNCCCCQTFTRPHSQQLLASQLPQTPPKVSLLSLLSCCCLRVLRGWAVACTPCRSSPSPCPM
jgi:hypothetical protein